MCTVTWLRDDDGYHLLCNRDEKLTRRPAGSPRVREQQGVRYIAPRDGDRGGTWLAVNEYGLTLCLLNGAASSTRPGAAPRTRGMVPLQLVSSRSAGEVACRVDRLDLREYAPFLLAILEPGLATALFEWDGARKWLYPVADPLLPLSSSSLDNEAARAVRQRLYQQLAGNGSTPESLRRFHAAHEPGQEPYSPCMHRSDARTVSFSWVKVGDRTARVYYLAGPPCGPSSAHSVTLRLRDE